MPILLKEDGKYSTMRLDNFTRKEENDFNRFAVANLQVDFVRWTKFSGKLF